jgi:hypothetical protein
MNVGADQLSHASFTPSLAHLQPTGNALIGGRALSPQAKAELPHANVESNVAREASHNAPHPTITPREQAERSSPMVQQYSPTRQQEVPHPSNYRQSVQRSAPMPHNDVMQVERRQAPGPTVRHPMAIERNRDYQSDHQQQLPHADVPRPERKTQMAPSARGGQRQDAPQHQEQHQDQHQGHGGHNDQGQQD